MRSALPVTVALILATSGCGESSPPSVPVETVRTYCEGLARTFDYFHDLAERGEYDLLGTHWTGNAQSSFSDILMQFHFCNDALVKGYAKDDDSWIAIVMEYSESINQPALGILLRLRQGEGSDDDRRDILKLLERSRELVERILRGGAPVRDEE